MSTVYHLLKRVPDAGRHYYRSAVGSPVFTTLEELTAAGKQVAANNPSETYFLVQEIGKVTFEPVVTMTLEPPQPHPKVVYRGDPRPDQVLPEVQESEGPKREPQTKPRLLILDRKATPAELVSHLMVVAEGRIVKNAFGALELGDMPLSGMESQDVHAALAHEGT